LKLRLTRPPTAVVAAPEHAVLAEPIRRAIARAGLRIVGDPAHAAFAVVIGDGDVLPGEASRLRATVRRRIHIVAGEPSFAGEPHRRSVEWNRGAWTTILPSIDALSRSLRAGVAWSHPLVAAPDPVALARQVVALLTV